MPSGVMGDEDYIPLSALGQRMMTHWPEQPNPAAPYVNATTQFLQSGDYNPVHEPGTQPRDYLRELLRNPDILARNIDQASNFNFGGVMKPIKGAGVATPLKTISGTMAGVSYKVTPEQAAQLKEARRAGAAREQIQQMVNEFEVAPSTTSIDVADRIKKAFSEIAGNPPRDAVRLNELREKLADIPRAEVDRVLLEMNNKQDAQLMPLDNPRDIRSVGDSALQIGNNAYHTLWLPRNSRNAASADILPRAADETLGDIINRLTPRKP